MMPYLSIDATSPVPPYEQIRAQLSQLIEHDILTPDDRLPPIRQLAANLGLAAGTVARAYRELELAGQVATRRGGGTRVAVSAPRPPAVRDRLLAEQALAYVATARRLGVNDRELLAAVHRAATLLNHEADADGDRAYPMRDQAPG